VRPVINEKMMKSAFIRNVALAAAALVLPLPAAAQTGEVSGADRIDEVRRDARVHVGPFYLTPSVFLKELGVDSNVFNAAGEQKSDFTFTVGPKVDLWIPVARRALLQGTAGTDVVWYSQYDTERSLDPQFAGRTEVYLRRITLSAGGDYLNTRQRLNYEVDLRARHVEQGLIGGVGLALTPKFSIETSAWRDERRFDGDAQFDGVSLQRTLNQTTTGLSVAGKHRLTALTTLVVRFERLDDEFPYSPVRDSESFRIMPGVEFKPRALISGTAYVGYRRFTPSTAGVLPDFSGVVARLGLSYTLLGSTTFGVSYSRDLTYSYEELQPFFVNRSVGASVRRALGRRFDVLVSADRHQYAYEHALTGEVPALPRPQRVDRTWNYTGSIGYRLGQGRIGVGVSYWQRESQLKTFRDYDNLRFGTTVSYGF
jgi:hypothetical protein